MAKTKETPHLRLRVEPSLLGKLEKAAEKNGRTLTGEINHRLGESFKKDDLVAFAERVSEKLSTQVTEVLKGRALTVADFKRVADANNGVVTMSALLKPDGEKP
jgi:hypothetical protein